MKMIKTIAMLMALVVTVMAETVIGGYGGDVSYVPGKSILGIELSKDLKTWT
jgi:hypothetical protein